MFLAALFELHEYELVRQKVFLFSKTVSKSLVSQKVLLNDLTHLLVFGTYLFQKLLVHLADEAPE